MVKWKITEDKEQLMLLLNLLNLTVSRLSYDLIYKKKTKKYNIYGSEINWDRRTLKVLKNAQVNSRSKTQLTNTWHK